MPPGQFRRPDLSRAAHFVPPAAGANKCNAWNDQHEITGRRRAAPLSVSNVSIWWNERALTKAQAAWWRKSAATHIDKFVTFHYAIRTNWIVPSDQKGISMTWGLIGASTVASEYVIGAIRSQGFEIASVMSGDAARGADYADRHAIPGSTTDLHEMLGNPEIDAVYISTTNERHHPQAMAAIAAGKHVLCEKPLAMTTVQAAEMVRAAAAQGVVLATNHHLRNAGSHLAIRDLIADGHIGTVLSVRVFHAVHLPPHLQGWRINDASAGGGVIPDITVHDADTVRFYLSEDPAQVVALAGTSGMGAGVEDSVMSVWSMPSGVMVQTHESFTHPFAGSGVDIHGTGGSIFGRGIMTQKPVGEVFLVTAGGREEIGFDTHDLYARSLTLFACAVAGHGRPSADGVDGLKSLAVGLAVRDAAQTGRAVRVNYEGF
jgi:1,5-anhydro-D-fructose reductase (1,5-anhydro-D-mannitol-forming)